MLNLNNSYYTNINKNDSEKIFIALMSGEPGYTFQETSPLKLASAIKNALKNGSSANFWMAIKVFDLLRDLAESKDPETDIELSEREYDILKLISNGLGYKKIASKLFISTDTVKYHTKNIYRKLNVNSQTEAISIAIKKGII